MAGGTRAWAGPAAVAVVAAHDLLADRLTGPLARTTARFAAAAIAVAVACASGANWRGLGLARSDLGRGIRAGALAGACSAAAVRGGAAVPGLRELFTDERAAAAADSRGALATALARITLATVPPEEMIYRSALLAIFLRGGSRGAAVASTSILFGLSHISPTLATMGQPSLRGRLAGRPSRRASFLAGNVVVTAAAGAGLAWLRLRSGSVAAPLLAHAAANDAALLAGRSAHLLGSAPAGR